MQPKQIQRYTCKPSWPVRQNTVQTLQQLCAPCQETSLSGPTTSPSTSHQTDGDKGKHDRLHKKLWVTVG